MSKKLIREPQFWCFLFIPSLFLFYSITIFSFIAFNLTFTKLPVEIFGNPHLPYFTNSEFDTFFSLWEKKTRKMGKKPLITTDWCLSSIVSSLFFIFQYFENNWLVSQLYPCLIWRGKPCTAPFGWVFGAQLGLRQTQALINTKKNTKNDSPGSLPSWF